MKDKILFAEDERELSKAITKILTINNYDVTSVYNGKEALSELKENSFNVIILDIMMPVLDGISCLKQLRQNGLKTPVILLTAKSQIDEKVEGLDSGANDYLTKPFSYKELLARIRAVTRIQKEEKEKFEIGNLIFDKEKSELSNSQSSLHLNTKECNLMEILVKNKQTPLKEKEITNFVWQNEPVENLSLQMYISYLQNKFELLNSNLKIENNRKGYFLTHF
mgnify:FL=1